jgi:hypothetical protein
MLSQCFKSSVLNPDSDSKGLAGQDLDPESGSKKGKMFPKSNEKIKKINV